MSYGFTMDGRDFPCLDEGLPRKYRKMVCDILNIGCKERDEINFTEEELNFVKALTNNIASWKHYSDMLEDQVKRDEPSLKGMNHCWVYQKELVELLFTFQFTEAYRVLQKFKEYAVEEMEDTEGNFTASTRSTGDEEVFDASTDGGYLGKANFFRDYIKEYEEHLSFWKEDERPRQLTESVVEKTMMFIEDRL